MTSKSAQNIVFFALLPDEHAKAEIQSIAGLIREQHGLEGSQQAAERLHASLHAVGNDDDELIRSATKAADAVALPAFEVSFAEIASFANPNSKPLVLLGQEGAGGIRMLQALLGAEMKRRGLKVRAGGTPHVTLGYYRTAVPDTPICPVRWTVRDFALIRSYVGQGRYDIIHRWDLRSVP